ELARPRRPERVLGSVQIEARHTRQLCGIGELRVRLAREDLDRVPESGELARQLAGVDALATAMRIAAIHQIGDAKGLIRARHEGAAYRGRPGTLPADGHDLHRSEARRRPGGAPGARRGL